MKTIFSTATVFLVFLAVAAQAQMVDDFSESDWTRFPSTPGKVSTAKGKLHLKDGRKSPAWITVSKTFSVNVDKTPLFVVKVSSVSDRGTVKLIRKKPYDKRVALEMDRPGLYAIDMRERFGWQGSVAIETCLYAIGAEEEITYEYVKFAERLTPEEEDLISNRTAGGNVKLNVAPFELVPLFNTCSFYFKGPERDGLTVAYRKKNGPWLRAPMRPCT